MIIATATAAALSNHHHQQQQQQQQSLIIQQLQQELEGKDDALFEVSATLAAVQAETQHRIQQVETDAALKIRQSEEALRRAQQEANQAHSQLQRLQKEEEQIAGAGVVVGIGITPEQQQHQKRMKLTDVAAVDHSPKTKQQEHETRKRKRSNLAQHLLLHNNGDINDDIYTFLLQAQDSLWTDAQIGWRILELDTRHRNTHWTEQALRWSPTVRTLLRDACSGGPTVRSTTSIRMRRTTASRISGSESVFNNLDNVAASIREPLSKPNTTPGVVSENALWNSTHQKYIICHQWMPLVTDRFDVLITLFQDVGPDSDHVILPWWKRIQPTLLNHINIASSSGQRRRRLVLQRTADEDATVVTTADDEQLHFTLQLLTIWWQSSPTFLQDFLLESNPSLARSVVAILLDRLESVMAHLKTLSSTSTSTLDIIMFLQTLCSQSAGCMLLRAQMPTTTFGNKGGRGPLAPSGIHVLTMLLANIQIRMQDEDEDLQKCTPIQQLSLVKQQSPILRIFWMMMRTIQVSSLLSSSSSFKIPFSSLLEECHHHWLACLNWVLMSAKGDHHGAVDAHDVALVRAMLEEIQNDQEDLEEYRHS
jgi:hypothetical protein